MSIRTFRNGVLRYKLGLDGLRAFRSPRKTRGTLRKLAAYEKAKREATRRAAEKAAETLLGHGRRAERKKPLLERASRFIRSFFSRKVGA